jgi:hypothetical protein
LTAKGNRGNLGAERTQQHAWLPSVEVMSVAAREPAVASDPWNLTARNDFPKAVHAALLSTLGVEATKAFWSGRPLSRDGATLTNRELAQHIWRERSTSPLAWTLGLVGGLEDFLLERGTDFPTFMETVRRFANYGSFVQTRYVLGWLGPILVPLFRFGDPYRLLLRGAQLVSTKMSPGVDFRPLRWRESQAKTRAPHEKREWRYGSVWVSYPGLADGRVPAWDFTLQPGLEMLAAPRIFGLAPYESLVAVSDARAPESVVLGGSCARDGDRFLIDGTCHGQVSSFSRFLERAGYDPREVATTDVPVVVIDREYRCPRRLRTVLHAGCAYGAPGYIVRLGWQASPLRTKQRVSTSHADMGEEAEALEGALEDLHRRYLDSVQDRVRVEFFRADESIAVEGRHVCRGVPALLLRECLRIAQREGRLVFSYRELKRRPTLVSHPKNTGFETRLGRLRAALQAAECGLTLERIGRGRFVLIAQGTIEYGEH